MLPVVEAVAVPGVPVVGNPHVLVDGANIVVDDLDKEDFIPHIFYWGGFKLEYQIVILAEYGMA